MISWPDWEAVAAASGDEFEVVERAAVFKALRVATLAAGTEELEAQACHAPVALAFLVKAAVVDSAHRSSIAQVVRKLMQVPEWESAYGGLPRLRSQVAELHDDLQLAFRHKPAKQAPPVQQGVFDREHCCVCRNCAKPFAFKCMHKTPHYCAKHFSSGGQASSSSRRKAFHAPPPPPGFNEDSTLGGSRVNFSGSVAPQTRQLVAMAANDERFAKELDSLGAAVAPADVTRAMVQEGLELANRIRECLDQGEGHRAADAAKQLQKLTFIEGAVEKPSEESLRKQVEVLDMLDRIADYNELAKGSFDLLAEFCDIGYLEPETEEGRLLRNMLMQTTEPLTNLTHMETFRVSRHEEECRELEWEGIHPANNRVLLWHGTRATRLVSILKHGLSLRERKGWEKLSPAGTFDHGLYFADMAAKSLQYCDDGPGDGLLLVSEVCLGSMYCRTGGGRGDFCFDWNASANSRKRGCHSTWGFGRTWPDPNSFAIGSPSSVAPGVDIPSGPPVAVRCSDGTVPGLAHNEFVVYGGAQVRLRYLVRFRRGPERSLSPGGGGADPEDLSSPMASAPRVLLPPVQNHVVQVPYCLWAKTAASQQLQHVVRWQYFFEEKSAFDSTLPGWHSYGQKEIDLLEERYFDMQDGSGLSSARIRPDSAGYEYDINLRGMTQKNVKTGKTRRLRRAEFAFQKQVIDGGNEHSLSFEVTTEDEVHWAWEVEGDLKIDFRASFLPRPADDAVRPPTSSTSSGGGRRLVKATRSASAWSFKAPEDGVVSLSWSNYFKMSAPRVLRLDCRKEPAPSHGEQRPPASSLDTSKAAREPAPRGPCEDADELEALRAKEEARRACVDSLREHLSDYLRRNPEATYVSWIAAVHPENVSLDPRLDPSKGSAWAELWEELRHGRPPEAKSPSACPTSLRKPAAAAGAAQAPPEDKLSSEATLEEFLSDSAAEPAGTVELQGPQEAASSPSQAQGEADWDVI